jgi:DNA-binding GntR family transcriptional regulator
MPEVSENLPLYYRVLIDLEEKIKSGTIPENSMLTPEIELADRYGVSRNTIRHAISILSKEGYLHRIPGKGTFVLKPREVKIQNQWEISSIEDMIEITKNTKVDYGQMEVIENPEEFVRSDLKLLLWNKACRFQGIKYQNKKIDSFIQVYLPYEVGVQIDHKERGDSTIFLYLQEKLGIDITEVDHKITIGTCNENDAKVLNCKEGEPKVAVKRIYYHKEDPVEVSINNSRCEGFSLFYRTFKR